MRTGLHALAPSRPALPTSHARPPVDAQRIAAFLREQRVDAPGATVRALVDAGLDRLPLPAGGETLKRWQSLAAVAQHDLALVKLYEGHTDALAILAELEPDRVGADGALYGVWASESRVDPIVVTEGGRGAWIDGTKSWCSGAALVDRALVTATDAAGRRRVVELALDAAGVRVDMARWQAVGMRDSASADVVCAHVPVRLVGGPDAYLQRPGFWHGGAGIAACWFGAAAAIGTRVRDLQRGRDDVHALAHLGAIDGALAGARALLRACAGEIDSRPREDAMHVVLRARNAIAEVAIAVVDHAARALGPGPLCNEAALARRVADLPIFVRQARAEHDLVAQARALLADGSETAVPGWPL